MTRALGRVPLRALVEIGAITVAVAIGAGVTHVGARSSTHSERTIGSAFGADKAESRKLRAFVLFRLSDCQGNLNFARLFERDTTHVLLSSLLLVGTPGELKVARDQLQERGIDAPLALATRGMEQAMRILGAKRTPFLVVFDGDGVVRLAMPSPAGTDETVAFPKFLKGAVDQGIRDPLIDPE